jgi:amidase
MSGLVTEHVITRSVRDSASLLDVTCGPDLGDPYWAPPRERTYLEEIDAAPGQLRIAFTTEAPSGVSIHEDCKTAVREAAELCTELGHHVDEAAPRLQGDLLSKAFTVIWSAGCASTLDAISRLTGERPNPDQVEPLTWALYEMGRGYTAAEYILNLQVLQKAGRDMAHFLVDYDLWLTPTLSEPPLPLGTFDSPSESPLESFARAASFVPFTPICNATGQPAMSVPLFWNKEGLPIGTHFVARFGDEATLFRLAAQLEAVRPWAAQRPPVSA